MNEQLNGHWRMSELKQVLFQLRLHVMELLNANEYACNHVQYLFLLIIFLHLPHKRRLFIFLLFIFRVP